MRKLLLSFAIAGSIGLTGCSTPMTKDTAVYVPPYEHGEKTEEAKTALTFVRDGGFYGIAVTAYISVDDKKVAGIETGEATTIYLKPGHYKITLHIPMQTFNQIVDVSDRDMTFRFFGNAFSGNRFERIE